MLILLIDWQCLPTLVKDAPFCSGLPLVQGSKTHQNSEIKKASLQRDVCITHVVQRLQKCFGRGGRKNLRAEGERGVVWRAVF